MPCSAAVATAFVALWLATACGSGTADDDKAASAAPDRVVRRWLRSWCRLDPGMARPEIYRAMGPPTAEADVDVDPKYAVERKAEWSTSGRKGADFVFAAFFDSAGKAVQLQSIEAPVPCQRVRNP